jgi:hypothetical protein
MSLLVFGKGQDVALVLDEESLPPQFAEHRLWKGIKTDTTILSASTLRGW